MSKLIFLNGTQVACVKANAQWLIWILNLCRDTGKLMKVLDMKLYLFFDIYESLIP